MICRLRRFFAALSRALDPFNGPPTGYKFAVLSFFRDKANDIYFRVCLRSDFVADEIYRENGNGNKSEITSKAD